MSVNFPVSRQVSVSSPQPPSSVSSRGTLLATYQVGCAPLDVEKVAQEIAYEQTVEVSPELISSEVILEEIVGRVESIQPASRGRESFLVTIAYQEALAGARLPQLLNLIYGNISMKSRIRLVDLELPEGLLKQFPGPRQGISGIRQQVGVHGRPLLATALKPRGSSPEDLARMAYRFAAGGGDLVKDDHNLIDVSLEAFRERVTLIQQEVEQANQMSGRGCLYLPNLILKDEELEPACEILLRTGIRGALVSPFVIGLERTRAIAAKYPLVLMAHPTMSGAYFHDRTHGMTPGILLGTLFRLLGADASIFPNVGGRFTFSFEDCEEICDKLRSPLGDLRGAFPTPAGGMRWDNIPSMVEQFGKDSIYLIGSALISYSKDLQEGTRVFRERIEEYFETRMASPAREMISACEFPVPSGPSHSALPLRLPFHPDFRWEGRDAICYKASDLLPFQGVTRHELIGRGGEQTAFDLRYFEIAPGGFTSLEKHLHTHTIIGVRGTGSLTCGEDSFSVEKNDVAYVPPLAVHQLSNPGSEPFGFYCIVDHDRDTPRSP